MKIYFCGSIRGGRDHQVFYESFIRYLQSKGIHVLAEHTGSSQLSDAGEQGKSDHEIYRRDLEWLLQADAVIADVSTPSLGIGYEARTAEDLKKPVLCLYHVQEGKRLSAMIRGCLHFRVYDYSTVEEGCRHIDHFLDVLRGVYGLF